MPQFKQFILQGNVSCSSGRILISTSNSHEYLYLYIHAPLRCVTTDHTHYTMMLMFSEKVQGTCKRNYYLVFAFCYMKV